VPICKGRERLLDHTTDKEIIDINIPTGIPLVYELDSDRKPVRHYYLADRDTIKNAMASVEKQGKAKQATAADTRNFP